MATAHAGLVQRDSRPSSRPSLQPGSTGGSSSDSRSRQQIQTQSSFSDIGIVLPSLHLGSFSTTMTFDSLPQTDSTSLASASASSSPDKPYSNGGGGGRSPASDVQRNIPNGELNLNGDATGYWTPRTPNGGVDYSEPSGSSSRLSDIQRGSAGTSTGSSTTPVGNRAPSTRETLTDRQSSYSRMLPTPIPSTAGSGTGRTPTRETLSLSGQPQPRRASSADDDDLDFDDDDDDDDDGRDEENDSFNPTTSRSGAAAAATSSSSRDRERERGEPGTPQLKVVNGQHSSPRRIESVEYTAISPGASASAWAPSPSTSSPYSPSARKSINSSPPPPRGAGPPDPYPSSSSMTMYAAQHLQLYADPPIPYPPHTQQQPQSQSQPQYRDRDAPVRPARPASSLPQARPSQTFQSPSTLSPSSQSPASASRQSYPAAPLYQHQHQQQYPSRPQPPPPPPPQAIPVQAQFAQKVVPPEEVCIECAMRDQDMADVDVTSPGVWERESDVWYEELVRREVEEERRGIIRSNNDDGGRKPRSRGGMLTEANVAVWLTMNPKEPAARWQTLEKYVKSQAEVLAAENDAREATLREARAQDSRIRDTLQHVRRSLHDPQQSSGGGERPSTRDSGAGEGGRHQRGESSSHARGPVKLRASTVTMPSYDELDPYGAPVHPSSSSMYGYGTPQGPYPNTTVSHTNNKRRSRSKDRDVVLLESGLIMERVDIQREEKEERERRKAEEKEERRRTRKISRVSTSALGASTSMMSAGAGGQFSDASSMHSISAPMQGVHYGGSRSQISLGAGSVNGAPSMNVPKTRRLSTPSMLTPPRPPMARGASQSSTESKGTPRFFGFRHWTGAFGSEASVHGNSGSMMDMHLGLEQDQQEMLNGGHQDAGWTISQLVDEPEAPSTAEEVEDKHKRPSIGRLWKKMTGGKDKESSRKAKRKATQQQEDSSVPLEPPPPLSYLVSRSPHERASPQRHSSSPSRQSFQGPVQASPAHPRSLSTPVNAAFAPQRVSAGSIGSQFVPPASPSTAASMPRYSPRDSVGSGDDRRLNRPFPSVGGDDSSTQQQQFVPVISEDGVYEAQSPMDRSTASATTIATIYGPQTQYQQEGYGNEWRQSQSHSQPPRPSNQSQMGRSVSGRPMSVASMDKDLPPLPPGGAPPIMSPIPNANRQFSENRQYSGGSGGPGPAASRSSPVLRPITSYEFMDYRPPVAPFKSDVRRQSFSGKISGIFSGARSRQNSDAGLVPPPRFGTYAGNPSSRAGEYAQGNGPYNAHTHADEFGASTPDLGRWGSRTGTEDEGRVGEMSLGVTTTYSLASPRDKRGSRTGSRGFSGRLSAIFGGGGGGSTGHISHGKQASTLTSRPSAERDAHLRYSAAVNGNGLAPSDGERYARQGAYGSLNRPASRSEVGLGESISSTYPRHSMASSRRYDAVIPQERDFIAMRYPTESERLDLMRRS